MQMLLSEKGMAEHLGVDFRTYRKLRDGEPVQMGKARTVMENLGVRHIEDILSPESLAEYWQTSGTRPTLVRGELPSDWIMLRPTGKPTELSNGLRFQAWQLCQRHIPERLARGKRYDLSQMAEAYRCRSDEFLQRHTRICDTLRKCPFIADNLVNMSDDNRDGWWVIDQWYQGPTLAEMIESQALAPEQTPAVMRQIAQALEAIHKTDVICRELSPEKVIYDFTDNSVVLTDFEMGKLFDGSPTVRGARWPKNRYRAPEAEGVDLRKEDHHVDLYSWGRIVIHAVTGDGKTEQGNETETLNSVSLPKKVHDMVMKCVDLDRRNRPKSATAVLRAISSWK
jgi:serine/threonine protein kinase